MSAKTDLRPPTPKALPHVSKQGTTIRIYMIDTGLWRIDKTFGKKLLKIEIQNGAGDSLSHTPTHEQICEIISGCLEAELENDTFTFLNGSKRPTQVFDKCLEMRKTIGEWEWKAKKAGLKGAPW